MSDPMSFAILTAYDQKNLARQAFRLSDNVHGYCKAADGIAQGIAEEPTIDSQEPTPAPLPFSEGVNYGPADRILLRLDQPPKDRSKGWQFGTNPRVCDYLLGHRGTNGISSRQFCITITQQFRVELHDTSKFGTCVSHDGQAKHVVVKDDKRLLSFKPGATKQWEEIIIYVPDEKGMAFTIEFPNHRAGSGEYWKNLEAFVNESGRALPPLYGLGLDNDGEIGHGEFGAVYKVIDVREGDVYASKRFKTPTWTRNDRKKRKLQQEAWLNRIRNEYAIMKDNPHPNIVQVIYLQEKPEPAIVMEYCSLGNLEDAQGVDAEQYVSASRQVLLGLRHLHLNRVAHRDLKPANLLVANRYPFRIKISDFGLSKVVARDDVLRTFCGTRLYAAPEVYPNNCTGYWPSVDIWSAGVIVLQFLFGLPYYSDIAHFPATAWIEEWSVKLVQSIDDLDENDDKVIDILKHMVTPRPEDRFTADQCLQRGCDNGLFKRRSDGQIVDADAPSKDDATEVATEAETEIATQATDNSDDSDSDDSIVTPTQALQGTESGTSNAAPSILGGELCNREESDRRESAGAPSSQLTPVKGSNSGPPSRRRKMSHVSSWSLTIGPGHSNSDGGFDLDDGWHNWEGVPATGVYVRKDHFTASLEGQFTVEDDSQQEDEAGGMGQELVALPEPGQEISQPSLTGSFAAHILQLQA